MNQIAIVNCTDRNGDFDQVVYEDHWCLFDFTVRNGNYLYGYVIEQNYLN